jgi:hypothetical protein
VITRFVPVVSGVGALAVLGGCCHGRRERLGISIYVMSPEWRPALRRRVVRAAPVRKMNRRPATRIETQHNICPMRAGLKRASSIET